MVVARHVGLKRLLWLADYLDTVPPETFDMSRWWCGTKGCAMGHAAQMPTFRRLGLRLVHRDEHIDPNGVPFTALVLGDKTDFDAAAALFGLSVWEAESLFNVDSDAWTGVDPRTPADVAGEIRAFVARARGRS